MQVAGKSERSRQKLKNILGSPKLQSMLSEYDLAADVKDSINCVVEKKHSEDPDLVLDNMFSIFSFKHKIYDQRLSDELDKIRHSLFKDKIKKVRSYIYIYISHSLDCILWC